MEGDYQNKRWRQITPELQQAAWQLREALTPAEQVLWEALRDKRLNGLKFRRQHPVEQFILDFYCPLHKLAVELDGSVHDAHGEQDAARTAHLEAHGLQVHSVSQRGSLDGLAVRPRAHHPCPSRKEIGFPLAPNNGGTGFRTEEELRMACSLSYSYPKSGPPIIGG